MAKRTVEIVEDSAKEEKIAKVQNTTKTTDAKKGGNTTKTTGAKKSGNTTKAARPKKVEVEIDNKPTIEKTTEVISLEIDKDIEEEKTLVTATAFIDDITEKNIIKREKAEQKKLKKINKEKRKQERKEYRKKRKEEIEAMDLTKENSFSEQNYIAITQTDLLVNTISKNKRLQMLMVKEANNEIENEEDKLKQIGDADLGLSTFFINALIGSFFFGFFVHFVSNIIQYIYINKVELSAERFKKIFIKSLKCGLVSLLFGVIIIVMMLVMCLYNESMFEDPNAVITLRLIAFISSIALAVLVNIIMYTVKLKSLKYALICFMKSLPALILYVIFVEVTTLLLSIVPAIVAAILAKLALRNIFNTEIYVEEKKTEVKKTTTRKTVEK